MGGVQARSSFNGMSEYSEGEDEDPMRSFYEREKRLVERESDEGEDLFGEDMERSFLKVDLFLEIIQKCLIWITIHHHN